MMSKTLRKRLRELANERRRFGYRRLGILLASEGFEVNHKKLFRLYREEGLSRLFFLHPFLGSPQSDYCHGNDCSQSVEAKIQSSIDVTANICVRNSKDRRKFNNLVDCAESY